MKTYQAKFNPKVNGGVYAISLVENPAMEGLFIALSKQEEIKLAEVDKEQRILMGLVLEPNKAIYRNQGGEEFNIVFSEETIKELSHNFFKLGYQQNSTIEHESKNKIEGVTFVESWIVENTKIDKSANFGFSYPKGSWIATMKVDSDEVWENYVKTGKVQGISVDAMLSLEEVNLKSNINMSKEQEKSIWDMLSDLPNKIALALNPPKEEVKVELGSIKTADGAITIEYEGEALMVGQSAWIMAEDGTKVPVPVGEHALEDGTMLIVTEEGVVAEVKAVESEEEEMAEQTTVTEGANNDAKIAEEISTAIKSILIKYSEQEKKIEALESQVVELGKTPVSKGIKQADNTNVDLSKMSKKERILFELRKQK
jgi:hypothetical protein